MLAVSASVFTGCNDFLDDNRWPLDKQTNSPAYWNNEVNVKAQANGLYDYYTGYGNGTSWVNNFYYKSLSDNQSAEMQSGSGVIFSQFPYQYAPENNSTWDASYAVIRKCNSIITNVRTSTLPAKVKENYEGIARLNRAFQYWDLVRNFGDVTLVEGVLDPTSPELYADRTDRDKVMDFVLEDLNYAVAHIIQQANKVEFSVDMANAMKSQICLFEASYARYHKKDDARAKKYFEEVINACNAVMGQSYQICDNYQSLYNSVWAADANKGFISLRDNKEVIFMKGYIGGVFGHSMLKYLSSNTPIAGMTKDAFDSYLFLDGKPSASTSMDKSDVAEPEGDKLSIKGALAVRDKRLGMTIDPYLSFGKCNYKRENSDPLSSNTGYTISKFINPGLTFNEVTNDGSNFTCAPIYWLANIYMDYAEAKAELGQLTDADLNNTVNKLFKRAGLPEQTVAGLSAINDPRNDMGVSSLLWEIRRCRRCEFMFDNDIRYWDLVRWHQLDKIGTNTNPNKAIVLGANVSKATAEQLGAVITEGGYINSAALTTGVSERNFTDREYFRPLGTTLIKLVQEHGNKNFQQNPGW